jgi:hypothetical protein
VFKSPGIPGMPGLLYGTQVVARYRKGGRKSAWLKTACRQKHFDLLAQLLENKQLDIIIALHHKKHKNGK